VKFHTESDVLLFLADLGELQAMSENLEAFEPTNEQMGTFLKKRDRLESALKNHRKSQIQKGNWRKNRSKMMKGIKSFHKSVTGKRFHRNLGNFLATRLTGSDYGRSNNSSTNENIEFLKSLNSAKTHLYIELGYYHQVYEQVELEDFTFNYAYSLFRTIETKMLNDTKLTENEIQFLFDITETAAVVKSFADKSGRDVEEVEELWSSIRNGLLKAGKSEEDDGFYKMLVGILKKQLNLT
jgi:hypothetical protein